MRVSLRQFDDAYAANPDPWRFETSDYEQRKYAITVASLPRRRYRRCFEPGCSVGALTSMLATRCDHIVALESSFIAWESTSGRLAQLDNVSVIHGSLPENWPDDQFDLIVWSELGYYWDAPDLSTLINRASLLLTPHGHLVAVHWLGRSSDHLLHGSEVHEVISQQLGRPIIRHADTNFHLDIWETP